MEYVYEEPLIENISPLAIGASLGIEGLRLVSKSPSMNQCVWAYDGEVSLTADQIAGLDSISSYLLTGRESYAGEIAAMLASAPGQGVVTARRSAMIAALDGVDKSDYTSLMVRAVAWVMVEASNYTRSNVLAQPVDYADVVAYVRAKINAGDFDNI